MASSVNVAYKVNKAASTFLKSIGRRPAAKSMTSDLYRTKQSNHLLDYSSLKVDSKSFRQRRFSLSGPSDGSKREFSHLEKCIHLKGSQLMKDLDDEMVLQEM